MATSAAIKVTLTATFCEAQLALLTATNGQEDAFLASAGAAYEAHIVGGVTLKSMVAANIKASADVDASIGGAYLYTSEAMVGWHAAAGMLLALPESTDDGTVPTVPTAVGSLTLKVGKRKGCGMPVVRKAIRKASTRQEAIANLNDAYAAAAPIVTVKTMADLLVKVAEMLEAGAEVTDETRAAYAALASLAPEGVTVVAAPVALVEAA